ncbi:MAG: protein arginine kinase [Paenibacillaceae bacterium]|nr:protein arginine kinase [Paenibacillaceae bacterium]
MTYDALKKSLWMYASGPDDDVVVSSRIRLARNIAHIPFPEAASDEHMAQVLALVAQAQNNDAMQQFPTQWLSLSELDAVQLHLLIEKHVISPQLAQCSEHSAVMLSEDESLSVMVNEEDHLRMQVLLPGLQLHEAWRQAYALDEALESTLDFAFHDQLGYLTSCLTNVGTGIRASVMLHLPGLALKKRIHDVIESVTQIGLVVRGLYGEGTDAKGNLYQVSNQMTLGKREEDIIDHLQNVVRQIVDHEKLSRSQLIHDTPAALADRLWRSFGALAHAHIMTSKEATEKLSDLRFGIDIGLIDPPPKRPMNELLVMTQPGFLQMQFGDEMSPMHRDVYRAKLLREALADR